MHVANNSTLVSCLAKHVGVAWIETFDGSALIACGERADEVIPKADEEDMPVKRRAIFLAHDQHRVGILPRNRMFTSTWNKMLPVQNPVVFVGHQFADDFQIFCPSP